MAFVTYLHRVVAREDLTAAEAELAMGEILEGQATTAQIAAFLVGLRMKGERAAELLGFARAMRARSVRVITGITGRPVLDTCGTGGDGGGTFNVSTAVALVVAGAGVAVAKHGNRSLSSQCGSADVLEELGVEIALPAEMVAAAIRDVNIGFLFAPAIHPAMKYAQPARAELKMRTAFNLLGPLTNPAGASAQLIGAPSVEAARLMAEALCGLEVERALVVHGSDGLDEITTTGPTTAFLVSDRKMTSMELTPADFGVEVASILDLQGGDRARNAEIIRGVLAGDGGAKRDIVLVNAAAALWIAGEVDTWRGGVEQAALAIDSGKALRRLRELASIRSVNAK